MSTLTSNRYGMKNRTMKRNDNSEIECKYKTGDTVYWLSEYIEGAVGWGIVKTVEVLKDENRTHILYTVYSMYNDLKLITEDKLFDSAEKAKQAFINANKIRE